MSRKLVLATLLAVAVCGSALAAPVSSSGTRDGHGLVKGSPTFGRDLAVEHEGEDGHETEGPSATLRVPGPGSDLRSEAPLSEPTALVAPVAVPEPGTLALLALGLAGLGLGKRRSKGK